MTFTKLSTILSASILLGSVALPALADTNVNTSASVNGNVILQVHPPAVPTTHTITTASGTIERVTPPQGGPSTWSHADIEARISALKALLARLSSLHQLPTSASANITSAIQMQIDRLTALLNGTSSATSTVSISASGDLHNATLVIGRAAITTAADHILTVAGQLENLAVKLEARISSSAVTDTSNLMAVLADMKAKTADAKVQANAALTIVANLMASDTSTTADSSVVAQLKAAQADIVKGRQDIAAAYQDAQKIFVGIKGTPASTSVDVNASTHADVNANQQ